MFRWHRSNDKLFDTDKYACRRCRFVFQTYAVNLCLDPCLAMPCGSQGRCLVLNAAPKGYMCMCQADGVSFTTIDTCPSKPYHDRQ
jgi:hypothetical protein